MIRGVNLGGWLVLEPWITPALFEGTKAKDELSLCRELGDQAEEILRLHRDHFITEADFRWLARCGINTVRLPIGYWVFGDEAPYVGSIVHVDRAFEWAERNGLKILLDLHGAPGSQNGHDHSGMVGDITWYTPENQAKSLKVIERLSKRYRGRDALAGIELVNEPSWRNGRRTLQEYYEKGYDIVRKSCGTDVAVVVSDAFFPRRWSRVMQGDKYQNKQLDIHLYQLFGKRDQRRSLSGHMAIVNGKWHRLLARVSRRWPVIIGEWSAALPPKIYDGYSAEAKDAAIRAYASAQLAVFERHAAGWFYWTYRTQDGGAWSFRTCVENRWLPDHF